MNTTPAIIPKDIRCENTGCSFYWISGYSQRGYFDSQGDFRTLDGISVGKREHNIGHVQFQ